MSNPKWFKGLASIGIHGERLNYHQGLDNELLKRINLRNQWLIIGK